MKTSAIPRPLAMLTLFVIAMILGVAMMRPSPPLRSLPIDPHPAGRSIFPWLNRLPLTFERNQGQNDAQVQYIAFALGHAVYMTGQGPAIYVREPAPRTTTGWLYDRLLQKVLGSDPRARLLPLEFAGAQAGIQWRALEQVGGHSNYYTGADPARWQLQVPHYARLWAVDVYPGVDATFYGAGARLEYDLRVAPGADPGVIELRAKGYRPRLLDDGNVEWRVGSTAVVLHKPVAYQQIDGARREVAAAFRLRDTGVAFALGEYDHAHPLVIDPVLDFAAVLGGADTTTNGLGLAVDTAGNAYIAGSTCAQSFPATPGAYGTRGGLPLLLDDCEDVFVTKYSADGSKLLYSTFLRGSRRETAVRIAVDTAGAAYVTGMTQSTDFPTTAGAYRTTANGGSCPLQLGRSMACLDAFVTKISPSGGALSYSTYVGGSGQDAGLGIAVDAAGAAYVGGFSNSSNFPVSGGAPQTSFGGAGNCFGGVIACPDAVVFKLSPDGATLQYSTYLGGSAMDVASAIAVNGSGEAYVTGFAQSQAIGTTAGSLQPAHTAGAQDDGFIGKLNAAGTAFTYLTFIGGNSTDWPTDIKIDSAGAAYVAGTTNSTNFPVTGGAYQTSYGGSNNACVIDFGWGPCGDGFVVKLNAAGSALGFGTLLGGAQGDSIVGLSLDASQNVWVTGGTNSSSFPLTSDAYYTTTGGNAFLAEFSPNGQSLLYSTMLFPSNAGNVGTSVVAAANGSVYVAGNGSSSIAGSTPGSYGVGTFGAFLERFSPGAPPRVQLSATSLVLHDSNGGQTLHSMSAAKSVTLTNSGTGALRLQVGNNRTQQDHDSFLVGSDCPATLTSGQSCTLSAREQPRKAGGVGGAILILDNAPGSPHSVGLSGFGGDAQGGQFLPQTLDLGPQAVGTSTPQNIAPDASLSTQASNVFPGVYSATVGGPNAADFIIDQSQCTPPATFCYVKVRFAPGAGANGTRTATLSVEDGAYGSPHVLTLTGTVVSGPALATATRSLDFANVATGSTATLSFQIRNPGSAAVHVTGVTFGNGDYAVTNASGNCGNLPITLNAGALCNLAIVFTPSQAGLRNTTMSFTSDAVAAPASIPVYGVGFTGAAAQLQLSDLKLPRAMDFGTIQVGTTLNVPQTVSLYNFQQGTLPATVSVAVTGDFQRMDSGPACTTVPAGSSCTFGFTFAPTAAGVRTGTATFTTNSPSSPFVISLRGTGVYIPTSVVTPAYVDFGPTGVGRTSAAEQVTLRNDGNGTLHVASIGVTGPFAATNTCGAPLAPASTCTINITATPTANGRATGLVTIIDDAAGKSHGVALQVDGVTGAVLQARPRSIDFGPQAFGSTSASRSVVLTSTGTDTASLGAVFTNGDYPQTNNCGNTLAPGASCTINVSFRPSLESDPLDLVGYVAAGGSNVLGSPLLVPLQGRGAAAAGARTTTTLVSSANPAGAGDAVEFTATVTSSTAGTITGNVEFRDGNAVLGTDALASGTAHYTASTLAAGSHSISAAYLGNGTFAPSNSPALDQVINASGSSGGFSVSAAPASRTVDAGASATYTVSVTPSGGGSRTVNLGCSGLPAGASCSFAPASLTLDGSAAGSTLTIATGARTAMQAPSHASGMFAMLAGSAPLALLLTGAGAGGRTRRRRWTRAALLAATALALSSCGGGGGGGSAAGTPAGSYTVTIKASSGGTTHSTTVTLVVN